MAENHLVGLVRDEFDKIQKLEATTNRFQSERNISYENALIFGPGWLSDRVMQDIPLYLSDERVSERIFTDDYHVLPKDLTSILETGMLRTSGNQATDYSILMSVTEHNGGNPPEGRTGVLLYKGEPIRVEINGKEFVVEIKGVGCPDGDNTRTDEMSRSGYFGQSVKRYGSATEGEGRRELGNIEFQRGKGSKTFQDGDSVRAAGLFIYDNDVDYGWNSDERQDQAYLIRLAPSNVRSSFNSNPAFPKIADRETLLATTLGQHYAELASLEGTLLHSTIHPENILFTGSRYVMTDFADCRRLDQLEDPHDFLRQVLEKVVEVPGLSEDGVNLFYDTIAIGLGVEWDKQTGYDGFIESIWSGFFSPRVFEERKKANIPYEKAVRDVEEYCKTADEFEQEIADKIPERIADYKARRDRISQSMANTRTRVSELEAVGDDGERAKNMYPSHFGFSTGQDAIDYIQMELRQKRPQIEEAESEQASLSAKIEKLEGASGDMKLSLEADSSLGSFYLNGIMQSVVGYLQNEINVLRAVNSAEARENLQTAQQKLQLAETMQGNTFSLLHNLKQDPNYIRSMIDLPYNTSS
jgi:hypothetical protein